MTQRSNSAGISPNVSRAKLYQAFAHALRLYIGRGKRHSYKDVERGAGVSARMIEAYRYEQDHEEWRAAPVEHIFSIAGFIGPDFTNEILPRSEAHTSELQSLMRISYAVFCLHKIK